MFKTDLLWQNDERWAAEILGFGPPTIKEWGCLLTSFAMVVNGYGYQETPSTLNQKMKQGGGFQGAMVMPAAIPGLFPAVQFQGMVECEKTPAPIERIDAHIQQGNPALVHVDRSNVPGIQSHWVVVYAREGNDYLMLDPYRYSGDAPGKKLKLLERYKYGGQTLSEAIIGVIFFAGSGSPPAAAPPAKTRAELPSDPLELYPTADGLALRGSPNIQGYLITRIPEGQKLLALEDKAAAAQKIGQYNQWLHVQASGGQQGYVAAWYVRAEKAPAPKPPQPAPSAPAQTDSGMIVKPTTDGLAFRTQPQVSDATLIKRLPISARLKVLEPAAQAAAKLGVQGQWLQVSDVSGQQGYVAAWYVTDLGNPALGVKETGRPAPTQQDDPIVYAAAEGLAFRSQPLIADNTLIKRLPLQAELLLLDPADAHKIGVQGQWIKVRDVTGSEGYVAAWYVAR